MQHELNLKNSPRALVSNYVNGKVLPSRERLEVLCNILNCGPDDLMDEPDHLRSPSRSTRLQQSESEFQFRELPNGEVQLIMDMQLDWNSAVEILEIVKEFRHRHANG